MQHSTCKNYWACPISFRFTVDYIKTQKTLVFCVCGIDNTDYSFLDETSTKKSVVENFSIRSLLHVWIMVVLLCRKEAKKPTTRCQLKCLMIFTRNTILP